MQQRSYAIDLLRGLAIIGMVLSGQMLWNAELPAWIFHAQVPPPNFSFDPSIPGITWVDLVFPFFLFSMGAAFPQALRKRINEGASKSSIAYGIVIRWIMLVLFAIGLGNLRSGALGDLPDWTKALFQLATWGVFTMMFIRSKSLSAGQIRYLHLIGIITLIAILLFCRYGLGLSTTINRSDIIILVLANMALFGSVVWWLTRDNIMARLGILAVIVAMKIGASTTGSWNAAFWEWTPVAWLFKCDFLKYLCIIIPGTIAGEIIYEWLRQPMTEKSKTTSKAVAWGSLIAAIIVCINMWGLFSRHLVVNFVASVVLGVVGLYLLRSDPYQRKIYGWGLFWLAIGLILEAYEGGIKKDHATISYFFTTSGLASMVLVAVQEAMNRWNVRFGWLVKCGQNPMIAYTAAGFIIMPILTLLHLNTYLAEFSTLTPWCGFYRGVIITAIVMTITILFTNKKIFWRT